MCCSLVGLLYSPYRPACLDVPTFAARYLHVPNDARDPSSERWNCVGENWPVILPEIATSVSIQGSFTCRKSVTWDWRLYFPSEGRRAEDFFRPEKSWRLRPGLNQRTWVLKGSMLPLDHRSRSSCCIAASCLSFGVRQLCQIADCSPPSNITNWELLELCLHLPHVLWYRDF